MQVEKDIKAAIDIINMKKVDPKYYRPVKMYPNYSLKFFKKYKLDGRKVLTKCNSIAEVLDLVSYNADVTCYSSNRLDEYFLKLQLALLNLEYNEYMKYMFSYKQKSTKILYDKVKEKLDEETRYFFDEIYNHLDNNAILGSSLFNVGNYDKETLEKFIRYFLRPKYYKTHENSKINNPKFILCKDISVPLHFEDGVFSFINLSYNIDKMDIQRRKYILDRVKKDFVQLLSEFGKIQVFSSLNELEIDSLKRIDTRSIKDPNTENDNCKKDYAYVYRNE